MEKLTDESIALINLYNNMYLSKVQGGNKLTASEKNVYLNLASVIAARARYMRAGYQITTKKAKEGNI